MAEEIAKIRIEIDGKEAQDAYVALNAELKDVNRELAEMKKNGETGSDTWKELRNRKAELNSELKEMKHNIDINDASIDQLASSLKYWQTEARKAKEGSEEWIEATDKIQEIKPRLKELTDEMNGLGDIVHEQGKPSGGVWSNWKESVLAVFTGTGLFEVVKMAGEAIIDFGKEVFETTAKFEKYEAILAHSIGSHEAATKAMEDIKEMAKSTPFAVDELTESYVKFVNRGLQPTMQDMKAMADVAAVSGKSFEQLTEAILDGASGQLERFKELSIDAEKHGDKIKLSFKGASIEVDESLEGMNKAMKYFQENAEGVMGATDVISQTLSGRVNNLGDSFDQLKLSIGEGLKPVFALIIEAMSYGIEIVKDLFEWFGKLGENSTFLGGVWEAITDIAKTIWNTFKGIFETGSQLIATVLEMIDGFVGLSGTGNILRGVLDTVGNALRIVGSVALGALAGLQILADGFNILMNKGKEVANFFDADFKIDPKANFDTLAKNAETNFKKIETLWQTTSTAQVKTAEDSNNKVSDNHKKTQDKLTDTEKKEADKRKKEAEKLATDKAKAESDMLKKIEDMQIKAISNETQRKIAQVNLDLLREQDKIKKSLSNEDTKQKALEKLEKNHTASIKKIEDDARIKKEKLDADEVKKKEAADKKREGDEKKQRDDKLKADKVSLGLGFQAEIERAKLDLALTKTNSQAQWSAKLALMQTEIAYKNAKLKQEAAAEKQRIEESVADTAQKTADIKAIEERLSSQLRQNETQLQADKVKLQEQANEARRKNNQEFFAALEQAMTGDFNKFIAFIQTKTKAEMGENQKRFADFSKTTSATLENMKMAVDLLNTLNESYTKRQLSRLSNEKNANIAKLEEEYRKGVITKEELESKKSAIDKEYDAKESELKRQAFERQKRLQIAAALIQGSMAVLSALATPPFPLGIALAIVAGVKTAIDINKIKNTKFEGRSGGVFKNAGIAEGSSHGSKYGEAGIAMYDRKTGAEVGEIEGGEPVMVLSRKTYRNNASLINRLLDSSLNRNGAPISMRDGGTFSVSESTHVVRRMFEEGGVVDQEGAFESSSATSTASAGSTNAMIEKQSKLNEDIKKASETSAENSGKIFEELQAQTGLLNQIKNKPDGSREVIHAIDSLRSNISKANAK
jgi:hypothetical protein